MSVVRVTSTANEGAGVPDDHHHVLTSVCDGLSKYQGSRRESVCGPTRSDGIKISANQTT